MIVAYRLRLTFSIILGNRKIISRRVYTVEKKASGWQQSEKLCEDTFYEVIQPI